MSKTSLIEVSLVVMGAALAAFIVDAKEPVAINTLESVKTVEVAEVKTNFSQLIAKFDTDKNGTLNKSEVANSKNDVLMRNFKTIDTNKDASISTQELKDFSSSITVK